MQMQGHFPIYLLHVFSIPMSYCICCLVITPRQTEQKPLISIGGVISVQVLNEFASVASRKLSLSYSDIRETLQTIRAVCITQPLIIDIHELGLDIAERYGFSLYDSMIVSAALQSGCAVLYSEDMQQGQEIEAQIVITNPFLDHDS
jgi:predicted nucleic acid-binding protein